MPRSLQFLCGQAVARALEKVARAFHRTFLLTRAKAAKKAKEASDPQTRRLPLLSAKARFLRFVFVRLPVDGCSSDTGNAAVLGEVDKLKDLLLKMSK